MKATLKLTLHERFLCLGVFNGIEGADLVEWGFINKAQEMLAANDDVIKKYGMKQGENGGWTWNADGNKEEPYEFSTEISDILKKELKRRNDNKKIPKEFVTLATKVLED